MGLVGLLIALSASHVRGLRPLIARAQKTMGLASQGGTGALATVHEGLATVAGRLRLAALALAVWICIQNPYPWYGVWLLLAAMFCVRRRDRAALATAALLGSLALRDVGISARLAIVGAALAGGIMGNAVSDTSAYRTTYLAFAAIAFVALLLRARLRQLERVREKLAGAYYGVPEAEYARLMR